MDDEERASVRKAQEGDRSAFEALVRRYDRRILSLALGMTGNPQDAQDIFQETFLAAYRALPRFRMDSSFYTWIYRIAVNKAINFRRRISPGLPDERAAATPPGRPPGDGTGNPTPEDQVLRLELQAKIREALDMLSPRERMAFLLCHDQGLEVARAAEAIGCSPGAVKSYLFRARAKVKARLARYLES
jgi:RNA polymerase sigma-70 factor, ECF subfamily